MLAITAAAALAFSFQVYSQYIIFFLFSSLYNVYMYICVCIYVYILQYVYVQYIYIYMYLIVKL